MCPQYYQENAGATEEVAKYPDVITVRCNVGYRLAGGEEVEKKMACSETGTWLGDQRECTGRLYSHKIECTGRLCCTHL